MVNLQSPFLKDQPRRWLSLTGGLLAAALLRALPLMDNRFHPDEALYATFARYIASGSGSLLPHLVVDKPPLSFYLNGLSVLVFGGNEFAVRLPNFFASLVNIALLFALARRLYTPATAHLAAWILALSPFAILFSITVFIDPLLTAFVSAALWSACAPRPRPHLTGLLVAFAYATKQTALLFIPLVLAFALLPLPPSADVKAGLRRLLRFGFPIVVGLTLLTLALFIWDVARHAPVGLWEQGYTDNAPGRFIRAAEVAPRARAWLNWLQYFTASPFLNGLFLLVLPLLLAFDLFHPSRAALADFLITGYLCLFLAGHWLSAFNVWDRYLLALLPLFALLLARTLQLLADGVSRIAYRVPRYVGIWKHFGIWNLKHFRIWNLRHFRIWNLKFESWLLPSALCLFLIGPALTAARSGYPVGGDHGAYDGIDDVARFIRTLPPESVLYDHWLSWEFNFYLFDRPLYLSWFPTPQALATDLKAFGRTSPRYLVVPSWEAESEVRAAAAEAGFEFVPVHRTTRRTGSTSFVVYQLIPQSP